MVVEKFAEFLRFVIPAKAGIQSVADAWIPGSALRPRNDDPGVFLYFSTST